MIVVAVANQRPGHGLLRFRHKGLRKNTILPHGKDTVGTFCLERLKVQAVVGVVLLKQRWLDFKPSAFVHRRRGQGLNQRRIIEGALAAFR